MEFSDFSFFCFLYLRTLDDSIVLLKSLALFSVDLMSTRHHNVLYNKGNYFMYRELDAEQEFVVRLSEKNIQGILL